jgi:hypothetical protein
MVSNIEPSNPITIHRSPFTNYYALPVGARGKIGVVSGSMGVVSGSIGE